MSLVITHRCDICSHEAKSPEWQQWGKFISSHGQELETCTSCEVRLRVSDPAEISATARRPSVPEGSM